MSILAAAADWDPQPPPPRPWAATGRPDQLPPDTPWNVWLILAGRGWGKTRTGAEWVNEQAQKYPGTDWAVVAPTFGAARDVCVEGPSGILACAQPGEILRHVRSLGEVYYANGSKVHAIGAEDPDRLRGFNFAGAWADELAAWTYEATWWEGLVPAVRDPRGPCQIVVTTTPKPRPLVRSLLARPDGSVHITRGSTFDNAANLSATALDELRARYAGTRLGRQELEGEVLDDVEGALWTFDSIDAARQPPPEGGYARVVVGVDPAVSASETSDETGIVVAAVTNPGPHAEYWVLADRSGRYSPAQWATTVAACFAEHQADRVVAEVNNGGDMVKATIRQVDAGLPVVEVHASRGKQIRAEPVAALYEQRRVHHVGSFPLLEDQMTSWDPADGRSRSPDRVDALVWAVTELMSGVRPRGARMTYVSRR